MPRVIDEDNNAAIGLHVEVSHHVHGTVALDLLREAWKLSEEGGRSLIDH